MFLARDQLHMESQVLILVIALFAGIVGALLSVFLQKVAIALAGFAGGGYAAAMVLVNLHNQPLASVGFVVGGILGAILLLTIFDAALIILSALVGAAFFADGVGTADNALLVFAVALAVGVLVQTLQLRHSARRERRKVPREQR